MGLAGLVTVTLASVDYFSLGSSATDEDRAQESCTVYADFFYSPANLLADDYDWVNYAQGTATFDVDMWQGFEGNLTLRMDSASDRCAELAEGYDLITFDNMRFGMVLGGLSDYMTQEFESSDWWADDESNPGAYFTQYIAMNHPADTALGYDFIAYDWTSSFFVEADPEYCWDYETNAEAEEGATGDNILCGLVTTEETDSGSSYKVGDHRENVGSRYGYIQGNAWWYEDFPNLDFDLLGQFPEE